MFWIIATAIALLGAVGCFSFAGWAKHYIKKETQEINEHKKRYRDVELYVPKIATLIGAVVFIVGMIITIATMTYTQDPGQASVLVSFTGQVEGINYEPGLHLKAPWTNRVEYDIRNNTLSYVGTDGNNDNYVGGDVSGPQITFQDSNGVTGNIDLNIRYSVRGDSVGNIYNEYKTQQEFVNATLAPDVRAKTREILSKYSTSQVYNERDTIQPALVKALQESWNNLGVDVEEVYLQEVRYPDNVVNSFAQAQAARAEVETAKAQQEKARIEAETNKIKTQALSEPVLMEKLIDAIRNGQGTYVINTDTIGIVAK